MYPYLDPQFNDSGLMKYGAVNVVNHATKKPTAVARPNVYDLNRCDGSSPPEIHAYVAIMPC